MKTSNLLNLALALSVVTTIALPATTKPAAAQPTAAQPTATSQTSRTNGVIPQSAGVVIQLPANMVVDVGQKQDMPYTVPLAQPIYDLQGNEVIPAQAPVSIKIKPENGGAKIVAESIVVRGQIVPITAATAVIPGRTVTEQTGEQRARENSAVMGNLFGAIGGSIAPVSKRGNAFEHMGMIGGAVGILSGLSSPRNYRIVELSSGTVYVLQLQSAVTLPTLAMAPQNNSQSSQAGNTDEPAANQPKFDFQNVAQYTNGLENVLKAFKDGKMSLSEARRIIIAADTYANQSLQPRLYPPAGIRRQVLQFFDYTYEIDRK